MYNDISFENEKWKNMCLRMLLKRIKRYKRHLLLLFLASILIVTVQFQTNSRYQPDMLPIPTTQQMEQLPNIIVNLQEKVNLTMYQMVLSQHASLEKVVLLALIDSGFMDMALNFYETSIARFGIDNYLFIASDDNVCTLMSKMNIKCYVYVAVESSEKASVYDTPEFKQKMNIRTYMILDALNLGFTVLHSDVDVIYLQNPLNDISTCMKSDNDLAILWDAGTYNAGFLLVKPTNMSILVYEHMNQTSYATSLNDQIALNNAIEHFQFKGLKMTNFSTNDYVCGKTYFEDTPRNFAGDHPCPTCVVVHNNWIITKEAKRYRFKEVHMWMYDEGGYYSDPDGKYLTYTNPLPSQSMNNSGDIEIRSLQTALYFGHVLNRKVILPRFHKEGKETPLNSFIKISQFDHFFNNKYRESTFLTHPKVPSEIRKNKTDTKFWIQTKSSVAYHPNTNTAEGFHILKIENGPTKAQILEWFGHMDSPVLWFSSFHGLYGEQFMPKEDNSDFHKILTEAVKESDYLQSYEL